MCYDVDVLRPQDLLVCVRLAIAAEQPSYQELASALGMSASEVHAAVRRSIEAGLLGADRRVLRRALVEFIVHGVKYAFAPRRGRVSRGMPTAHGAPPLDALVGGGDEAPPVWPDPDGETRGESFEPLYPSVPAAARKDPKLYETLCLVDAIRGGRARDRALAEKLIKERIGA